MNHKTRVALVTGGGKRLGNRIALALAKNGFDVAINYHTSKKGAMQAVNSIRVLGKRSLPLQADISRSSDVRKMIRKVIQVFGRIDLLVNNSAIFVHSPMLKTSERIWDSTININLKGTFLCSQAVAPIMLKQKRGRIVNIASLGGLQAWKEHVPYSVSKAGVVMLTRIMARSLAPYILVNAIAPGTISFRGEEDNSVRHTSKKNIPLKKYGTSSDMTDMVVFLATKADYITGQVISIDGGRSIP